MWVHCSGHPIPAWSEPSANNNTFTFMHNSDSLFSVTKGHTLNFEPHAGIFENVFSFQSTCRLDDSDQKKLHCAWLQSKTLDFLQPVCDCPQGPWPSSGAQFGEWCWQCGLRSLLCVGQALGPTARSTPRKRTSPTRRRSNRRTQPPLDPLSLYPG